MAEILDVAVIGGGVAGLTAAAVLAKEGRRVAVFEKHTKLGGYAQYFGQTPAFDASPLVGGCGPDGWTRAALWEVGIVDRVELLPADPVYQAVFPDHRYLAPADPERFRQELTVLWPGEADGIRRFFAEMEQIGRAYFRLADGPPLLEPLARVHDQTLSAFLDGFTRNEELRTALSALWLYAGLPPERLSAVHYAMLWHTLHHQGAARLKGGAQALTGALAGVVTEYGGTVETEAQVQRIVRQGGKITGVKLEDGREHRTGAVISTASPHDTFEELLAAEGQTAAGYPPLRGGFVASVSAMAVHLLVDGALETPAASTILHATYDLHDAFVDLQREESDYPALVCTVQDYGAPEQAP